MVRTNEEVKEEIAKGLQETTTWFNETYPEYSIYTQVVYDKDRQGTVWAITLSDNNGQYRAASYIYTEKMRIDPFWQMDFAAFVPKYKRTITEALQNWE